MISSSHVSSCAQCVRAGLNHDGSLMIAVQWQTAAIAMSWCRAVGGVVTRPNAVDRHATQDNGVLAPIANVASTIAGAAAIAQLAITPSGVSLVLCVNVQAAVVAALKARHKVYNVDNRA